MPAWSLKLLATLLTVASAAASAVFVSGHVKNAAAPLHPALLPGGGPLTQLSLSLSSASPSSEEIQIQPSVQAMGQQAPVTSTYVS